jgi:hypothetical protein
MARLLAALVITISLGILSRLRPIGYSLYDKSVGVVLYAVAAYLVLALVLYRGRRLLVAALGLGACLTVEAFQATGIPARYNDWLIVCWLIGIEFSWHDVACYIVGVLAIFALDMLVLRPQRAALSIQEGSNCTKTPGT